MSGGTGKFLAAISNNSSKNLRIEKGKRQNVFINGPFVANSGTSLGKPFMTIPDFSVLVDKSPNNNHNFFNATGEGIQIPEGYYFVNISIRWYGNFRGTNPGRTAVCPVYVYRNGFPTINEEPLEFLAQSTGFGSWVTSGSFIINSPLGEDTRLFLGNTLVGQVTNTQLYVNIQQI